MNNLKFLYEQWKTKAVGDSDIIDELNSIDGDDDEILDRFYKSLEFGTAGLRGVIGAGTNRMNIYTVGTATQGLADYLNSKGGRASVAIAYDSRIKSEYFAKEAASILAANDVEVYLFDKLVPTPVLSFAVRHFHTSSGIIITASHNPSKYNGFKCYNPNGFQMTDSEANEAYQYILKLDCFKDIKKTDFDKAVADKKIKMVGDEIVNLFLNEVEKQRLLPKISENSDLKVIYTPLNGAGNLPVREILKRIGIKNVAVVKEQELPDGNFPTCPFPNPEIQQVFECALKMAKSDPADLLLATDPDSDRVGIAVPRGDGSYRLMSGNEVGVLLLNYILSVRTKNGTLPENPITVKTIVTTELVRKVADKYNCETVDLLTGFKYMGELITNLEEKNQAQRFVFGFEESYGYLAGTHARDKDAVVASMLICEMACYYKLEGKTLIDAMNDIYAEHGICITPVKSFSFEGASGMEKMQNIMSNLRQNSPKAFGGLKVLCIQDYLLSKTTDLESGKRSDIALPKSNVISFKMENSCSIVIRPSGTEPKVKLYVTAMSDSNEKAEKIAESIFHDAEVYMK